MVDLKVIKKDGSIEDFDIQKIIEACIAAGLSKKAAKDVAQKVREELHKVKSSKIREKILKYLRKEDPELAKKMIQFDINKKEKFEQEQQEFIV